MCFAISSSFVLAGNRPNCDNSPPTISCDVVSINLEPGTCVELQNPCGDHEWVRLDGFRLCDEPDGLYVQTERDPRARFICATPDIATLVDEPVDFLYVTPGDKGLGTLRVTVGATPLSVAASASPTMISVGGSSQLDAVVTGGAPPYSYVWTPGGGLSDNAIANPTASPQVSTQYTVVVTDSAGNQAGASVIVNVGLAVNVSANPSAIAAGGSSTLSVTVAGGTPPYAYEWDPDPSLSSTNSPSPVATPVQTTSYTVTVTDFTGATAIGSVAVSVALEVSASANPGTITAGGQSQLSASVLGGTAPYSYSWTPAASLDSATIANPVASPTANTTYTVVVTDATGAQASAQVSVAVQAAGVTACFTLSSAGSFAIRADASCSSGSIVQYNWWKDYRFAGQPPDRTTTTPFSGVLEFDHPGENIVRVQVLDASGGSDATTQTVVAQ